MAALKLNFELDPQTLQHAIKLNNQKPQLGKKSLFAASELFLGTTSWLLRQPAYLQKMVAHLGVYSFHESDWQQLKDSIVQNWKTPFINRIPSGAETHSETEHVARSPSTWQCSNSNCEVKNLLTQNQCVLCDKKKPASLNQGGKKPFQYDVFASSSKPVDEQQPQQQSVSSSSSLQSTNEMTLEEEAQAIIEMRERKQPFFPTYNHVFDVFQESETSHVLKMFSELEREEKVKSILPCSDIKQDQPRYLFALFKKNDQAPSQLLLIDKTNLTIEWFDPFVPPVTVPSFTNDDPRVSSMAKKIQSETLKSYVRPLPTPIQTHILPLLREQVPQKPWTFYVNREANKQGKPDQASDFYTLWYLMMRFGFERKGGPQSPEQLDQTSLPFTSAKMLFSEFFQE